MSPLDTNKQKKSQTGLQRALEGFLERMRQGMDELARSLAPQRPQPQPIPIPQPT
jgi:hypothetical protein